MGFSARSSPLVSNMLHALEGDLQSCIGMLAAASHPSLIQMMQHHFGWETPTPQSGGKRLRPLHTLLACQAGGGDWRHALPAASSVELIHNFSLIHDDIEDRSPTRHGRPTVWNRWGEAQAINAGDALFVLSRLACSRLLDLGLAPGLVVQVYALLDQAALHLTVGQHLDLLFEDRDLISREDYLRMIEGKTAFLFSAAVEAGAIIAQVNPETAHAYRRYGQQLGVAFQIMDDILGIWGDDELTGKPTLEDLAAHKKTLPVVLGLERSDEFSELWLSGETTPATTVKLVHALEGASVLSEARKLAKHHTQMALAALEEAAPSGPAASELRRMAEGLLHRQR